MLLLRKTNEKNQLWLEFVIIIVFDGIISAVQAALKKDHKVDGATLLVKTYKPPKTYPNKILVKGISQDTTTDALTNYLEARTKEEVVELEFNDAMSRIAIVTFRDSIGLKLSIIIL